MNKVYDIMMVAGVVVTNLFSWFTQLELAVKIFGIVGGTIAMVLGIIHKWGQIREQKLKEINKKNLEESIEEVLKKVLLQHSDISKNEGNRKKTK